MVTTQSRSAPPNNERYASDRDTAALIYINGVVRRVMPALGG
ncbi:MAG: hypothetical protein QOH49_4552 [Acidobacteriota bacterium]|nr:hypothetical protein [Acidobacteriota bacterium]